MKRKSASTLIYFSERSHKKSLVKRPKKVNKEKRSRKTLFALKTIVLFAFISLGIWYFITYKPVNITRVEITGVQRFVNSADVKSIVDEKALGKNIFLLNTRNLEKIVSENFLASKTVRVDRKFPKTIRVVIEERVPIALVLPSGSSDTLAYYFVDSEGFVLGNADKAHTNLPIINYSQTVDVGKFLESEAVKYYFDLIKALDDDAIAVSTISSYPRYTQFYTKEDNQVLFSNQQPAKSQVKIFAKMMEAFKAEGKKVRKIDLRFDKVIVEFIN